jgi:hypothetical protein
MLSNLSRLALELSAALKLRLPPFISMDGPWCPHWRTCEGRFNRVSYMGKLSVALKQRLLLFISMDGP